MVFFKESDFLNDDFLLILLLLYYGNVIFRYKICSFFCLIFVKFLF